MCVHYNPECVQTHVCVFMLIFIRVCVCVFVQCRCHVGSVCSAHAGSSVCLGSDLSFAGVCEKRVCV